LTAAVNRKLNGKNETIDSTKSSSSKTALLLLLLLLVVVLLAGCMIISPAAALAGESPWSSFSSSSGCRPGKRINADNKSTHSPIPN
jgi:flagellar basal body-associated protein FliL